MLALLPEIDDSRPSKRRRRNASGSISLERGCSGDFFLRSEDMLAPLRSEDILPGSGLDALTSEDVMMRLKSADIVKEVLLRDSAATAAAAVAVEAGEKSKAPDREEKIRKLRAKLEQNTTGDELVPLNTSFRIASENWIKDFEIESGDLEAVHPSLLLGNRPSSFTGDAREASTSPLPFKPRTDNYREYSVPLRSLGSNPPSLRSLKNARISSSDWVGDFKDQSVELGPMDPSLFAAAHQDERDAMAEQVTASPPPLSIPLASHLAYHPRPSGPKPSLEQPINAPSAASALTKKKKKSRKRMLDESAVVEPTAGDVLSGRGGFTNTHPGNIRFRQKALEFRPWYEESSKETKQEIADLLVNSVRNEGNRFLGRGKDGKWHEMIGNGPHRKASQALRERIRGGNGD